MYTLCSIHADIMENLLEKVAKIEDTQSKILNLLETLTHTISTSPSGTSSPAPTQLLPNATPGLHFIEPATACSNDQDPLSLSHHYGNKPLSSSEINKGDLVGVEFITRGSKAKSCKPGTLAQLLAKESFFGEAQMARCNPSGTKDLLALPKQQMHELKKTVFHAFPKYTIEGFECEWRTKCWPAIEQAYGHFRRAARKLYKPTQGFAYHHLSSLSFIIIIYHHHHLIIIIISYDCNNVYTTVIATH